MFLGEIKEIEKGRIIVRDAADTTEITVVLRDPDNSLIDFLKYLALTANPGHSFAVVVDPDRGQADGGNKSFGFDGDGIFWIESINGSKEFKEE